jgi:hypothetical protein
LKSLFPFSFALTARSGDMVDEEMVAATWLM